MASGQWPVHCLPSSICNILLLGSNTAPGIVECPSYTNTEGTKHVSLGKIKSLPLCHTPLPPLLTGTRADFAVNLPIPRPTSKTPGASFFCAQIHNVTTFPPLPLTTSLQNSDSRRRVTNSLYIPRKRPADWVLNSKPTLRSQRYLLFSNLPLISIKSCFLLSCYPIQLTHLPHLLEAPLRGLG